MHTNCDEKKKKKNLLKSLLGANNLSHVILSRRLGLHEEMLGMLFYIQQRGAFLNVILHILEIDYIPKLA